MFQEYEPNFLSLFMRGVEVDAVCCHSFFVVTQVFFSLFSLVSVDILDIAQVEVSLTKLGVKVPRD